MIIKIYWTKSWKVYNNLPFRYSNILNELELELIIAPVIVLLLSLKLDIEFDLEVKYNVNKILIYKIL